MARPTLADLPAPPAERHGWPWTEESIRPSDDQLTDRRWPRITVVTPSFNQGQYIEETIRSVLLQGYPDLEYFVLDGASTDATVEIIGKYSQWIDFWVSERDNGQSAAINRGLRLGTGSHATWINSDDLLCKDALNTHVLSHGLADDRIDVGDCIDIDAGGRPLSRQRGRIHSLEDLLRVRAIWQTGGYISQPAVLFPHELALRVGGLNESDYYSMDYELWGRLLLAGAGVHYTGIPFGMFRYHDAQKTTQIAKQIESTLDAAETLLAETDSLSVETKQEILSDLRAYRKEHPSIIWKQTGRLARWGVPASVVTPLRRLRQSLRSSVR